MTEAERTAGYLHDTHVALLALQNPEALSPAARSAILAGKNVLSVVSYWEVMLKSMKGTLYVGDPRIWWKDALDQLAAIPLTLRATHVDAVQMLPSIHKDPFDRMLIAQAMDEGLTLISADGKIAQYASAGLRLIN